MRREASPGFIPVPPLDAAGDAKRCVRRAPTEESGQVAAQVRIFGRVQGVGYRYWTRTRAVGLSLRGYVRNLTDGSVEALFIGEAQNVMRMLTFCEDGPPEACVSRVESVAASPSLAQEFDRFRRAPTRAPGAPI